MATFNLFQALPLALAEKKHNLTSDTLFVQLMNTAPDVAADAVETDLPADLSTGGGYTAGGVTMGSPTSSSQSGGVYKLVYPDKTITASGGTIGPFRYTVILNNTATNKDLIGYWDYGSSITLQDGEPFLIDLSPTNGLLQLVVT